MRIKLNSNSGWRVWCGPLILGFIMSLIILPVPFGYCDEVDLATARIVAENTLKRHLALYGNWNGTSEPAVANGQVVSYKGRRVAYNFSVIPSGHVLVAVDDYLSPVPLYSTRSSFDTNRAEQRNAIESWIIPETYGKVSALSNLRVRSIGDPTATFYRSERISKAWDFYKNGTAGATRQDSPDEVKTGQSSLIRTTIVGPLLTTTWGQLSPYNSMTPSDTGCVHTLTGCVATAWAQVLRYWQWPDNGVGSHSYSWDGQELTADFSTGYNWGNMPDVLDSNSTSDEEQAVSELMYHLGVSAEMDYGCSGSGSSAYADTVLDIYFRYKAMDYRDRDDYSAEEWFDLFKNELNASPPRPVIFSIFSPGGGHEVVVDGYNDDDSSNRTLHINLGWSGYEDGYYDVSDDTDFDAGDYDWYVDQDQYIVMSIEPNYNSLPMVDAGLDRIVDERSRVDLAGSASHSTLSISSYQWRQVKGPYVYLGNDSSNSLSFNAPSVSSTTELVFQFKAIDEERGVGFDEISIDVQNTDPPPQSIDSGGGGGGGCFISHLH